MGGQMITDVCFICVIKVTERRWRVTVSFATHSRTSRMIVVSTMKMKFGSDKSHVNSVPSNDSFYVRYALLAYRYMFLSVSRQSFFMVHDREICHGFFDPGI